MQSLLLCHDRMRYLLRGLDVGVLNPQQDDVLN